MHKIDTEYFKREKKKYINCIIKICVLYSIMHTIIWISNSKTGSNILTFLIALLIYNVILYAVCYFGLYPFIKKNNDIIKKCEHLEKHGILYHLPFNTKVSYIRSKRGYGRQIVKIEVEYELSAGNKIVLQGDKEYNIRILDDKAVMAGLVDLLIDPNDYKTYYIDFNIGENPSEFPY